MKLNINEIHSSNSYSSRINKNNIILYCYITIFKLVISDDGLISSPIYKNLNIRFIVIKESQNEYIS